jgi:hypothetical protein
MALRKVERLISEVNGLDEKERNIFIRRSLCGLIPRLAAAESKSTMEG